MRKQHSARPHPADLLVATALLTRLPLPHLPDHLFARQARAVWAFPLVGAVVGGLACAAGWVAMTLGLPVSVAAGVILATQIAATGAMHEDGLADTADGFWGGWTRERRLQIMRDSHIGTYGVLVLILTVGARWLALTALLPLGMAAIMAAAILSRAALPPLMAALPLARTDGLAHGVGTAIGSTAILSLVLGVGLAWLALGGAALATGLCAGLILSGLALLARARIGGHTGDVLGAAQQLTEVTVLLTALVLAPF
ncbi:adenosylcobinamide-GDP ribazoletransferase [Rhodobacteraceae bacterium F11138]|nr:adenosylcobinamide-GDP ribazoletransferase [Rhodobacteraceae bacterium F11138]